MQPRSCSSHWGGKNTKPQQYYEFVAICMSYNCSNSSLVEVWELPANSANHTASRLKCKQATVWPWDKRCLTSRARKLKGTEAECVRIMIGWTFNPNPIQLRKGAYSRRRAGTTGGRIQCIISLESLPCYKRPRSIPLEFHWPLPINLVLMTRFLFIGFNKSCRLQLTWMVLILCTWHPHRRLLSSFCLKAFHEGHPTSLLGNGCNIIGIYMHHYQQFQRLEIFW